MTMVLGAATPPESPARVDRRDLSVDITNGSGFRIGMEVASPARVVDMMMMTGTPATITGTPPGSPARVVDILMIIVGGAGRETSLFVF